jgi:hypothetical protein
MFKVTQPQIINKKKEGKRFDAKSSYYFTRTVVGCKNTQTEEYASLPRATLSRDGSCR